MESRNVRFPGHEFFRLLLGTINLRGHQTILDSCSKTEHTYSQLLSDVLRCRERLIAAIPAIYLNQDGHVNEENLTICSMLPSDYRALVAFFAITSIGAVALPIVSDSLPEEILHFHERFHALCILHAKEDVNLEDKLEKYCIDTGKPVPKRASFPDMIGATSHLHHDITLSTASASERAALILLSSGTTGPPKAIVHSLKLFTSNFTGLGSDDAICLSHRPLNLPSALTNVMRNILRGAPIELLSNSSPGPIWERLRQSGVTNLTGSSSFWFTLTEYFEQIIASLPQEEMQAYLEAARNLKVAITSGASLVPRVENFWRNVVRRPLIQVWGSTESSIALSSLAAGEDTATNLIGRPLPGVTVRLSKGDFGEMLIKTPTMFQGYWENDAATRDAFDESGFYRTGDIVSRRGDDYFIEGRAKTDSKCCLLRRVGSYAKKRSEVIRVSGSKVPIPAVERALFRLEYVFEAFVVAVADPAVVSRVAVLIRARNPQMQLDLETLREDLSAHVPAFMLPSIIRVLREGEEVPRTASGKVNRAKLAESFFPRSVESSMRGMYENVEIGPATIDWKSRGPRKMWDTGGVVSSSSGQTTTANAAT
ncbi:acetyl-CoA synthetase-like protein [Dissoconium aciculare CBS 342.82]|uniref:Acetyl-CoA synthetase-like protein n=1 Tax=Dissoconium aciculare CBS 342.82 TaxID=1314786 RepID=A0A6J3M001_9PEZI|nr:acetyl-CoA synthetase-like protein [Dissoconium aciculare CBS 342.82]KAF1821336.1 acetyl-CoA synthetase-like protein [Dissoconium aciculare CBS 342.82]